jgi:hypothetical protein
MLCSLPVVAALAAGAAAYYDDNINFISPSSNHPSMGIDMPKVMKRHLQKRDGNSTVDPSTLNFTHGVASVSVEGFHRRSISDTIVGRPFPRVGHSLDQNLAAVGE